MYQVLESWVNPSSHLPFLWLQWVIKLFYKLLNYISTIYLQVEWALTLWKDGSVSCETIVVLKAKKWSSAIIKTINKATSKESMKMMDFNQANWVSVTNGYLLSIKKALSSASKFNLIISPKTFMKATSRTGNTTASTKQNTLDEQAFLWWLGFRWGGCWGELRSLP